MKIHASALCLFVLAGLCYLLAASDAAVFLGFVGIFAELVAWIFLFLGNRKTDPGAEERSK